MNETTPQHAPPPVPTRFKKVHFDSVAHIIGAALEAYPNFVSIDPKPYAIETVARKVREAIEAKLRFSYSHPQVDNAKFAAHASELRTSMEHPPYLLVGPTASLRKQQTEVRIVGAGGAGTTSPNNDITVSVAVLTKLCEIIGGLTPRPTCFVVRDTNFLKGHAMQYEEKFDVGFVEEVGGWRII